LIKTAILNVPRLEPHRPPPGPAIIANVCKQLGHDVSAYDLNIKFFHYCKDLGLDYHGFDVIWDNVTDPTELQQKIINDFLTYWCDIIVKENYDNILLSIFGMSGNFFSTALLTKLRPMTTARIIAGGMGIGVHSLTDSDDCFGSKLKKLNLIDTYIVGEGELSVPLALEGKTGPGINNTEIAQISDIDNLPQPDYSFYNLDEYDYLIPGKKEVYITGSRGCVRKCTYCDVEKYWPKYRFRSGQNIADEIIDNYERFGITRFYFTDSLVNGSFKAFNDMCEKLSQYRFEIPISWSGQFIFRTKETVPKNHFKMMKEAGADILYVGLETGSDRVRFDMGKKFTNDDIEFQLEECSKYGITVMPLMFTGYITETIEDHHENLAFFKRFQKYVANGTIVGIELGSNLLILPGAPVERMIDSHGLKFLLNDQQEPNIELWWSEKNPDLTIRERIRRKIEVHETAIQYNWPVWRQASRLRELKELIVKNNLHTKTDKKFFSIIGIDSKKTIILNKINPI
jgi:radical SAM superfamily enzyme YgiQ (UPF0313 family)